MNVFTSVTINDCHILRTYGLALSRTDCVQPPEPKLYSQDIPGADGSIDLSDSLTGYPAYNNRIIKMEFGGGLDKKRWTTRFSEILARFHGKKVKLIFDDDPDYYYAGRASISDYTRVQTLGTMIITVDADPYKYELVSSIEDWLWDNFNFETGMIRDYRDLVVDGECELIIPGRLKRVVPVITSSCTEMTVEFMGVEYELVVGANKIYDIVIGEGDNVLIFHGHGTVSVEYRGGIL